MSLPHNFLLSTKSVFVLLFLLVSIVPQTGAAASAPLVLYNFNEGNGSHVYDVSGNGTPLNLIIDDTGNTRWLQGGGLAIDRPTLIRTTVPARKITDAIKISNAFTIEAWVKPAGKIPDHPARIITLSADTRNRNVTLGQGRTTYNTRLRTTRTDANGTPSLSSIKSTFDTGLAHVVYTRNRSGLVRLYVNGILQKEKRDPGSLNSWDNNYSFALAGELTGNRPWMGNFYQVAVYSQALSSSEIDQKFTSGPVSSENTAPSGSINTTITSSSPATGAVATGSVTLRWKAPVSRSNGEALAMSEIAGYTIYYSNTAGSYPDSTAVNDAYKMSAMITGLSPGTYYFVVTARDTAGRESSYSSVTTRLVN